MKNAFMLGDSYTTFEGVLPEGNARYYAKENAPVYGMETADKVWLYALLKETGENLVRNESFSGSSICNTTYEQVKNTRDSFIGRLNRLADTGFFEENRIDRIYVFGGTNDSWADIPLGQLKFDNWSEEDLYMVLPAVGYVLCRLRELCPQAEMVILLNCDLKEEITEGLKQAGDYCGATSVRLHDLEKIEGHPTAAGMQSIKNQVLEVLSGK